MPPTFSIIIPVYNVAPYLRECLDSVMAQTYPNWEAICVDDGSTDGSGAILDEYAAADKRFRVFHQPNAGVSAARNKGLDEANGEYIWMIDSDDTICTNSLEMLYSIINDFGAPDIVNFHINIDSYSNKPNRILQNRTAEAFWRFRGGVYRSLLKRAVFGDIRFVQKMRLGEDTIFSLLCYYRARKIVLSEKILYILRRRPDSATSQSHTCSMQRDWMALQIRQMRLLRDNKEYDNSGMSSYFAWHSQYVFYTPNLNLFRLKQAEWRICRKSWLKMVAFAGLYHAHTWWKLPVLWFISLLPYVVVPRLLILWPYNLRTKLSNRNKNEEK